MENHLEDYLTIQEFSKILRAHPQTVRRAIKGGRIQAFRVGPGKRSHFRIPKSEVHRMAIFDLQDYLEKTQNGPISP
jgi:excisionase family DNA binding protein